MARRARGDWDLGQGIGYADAVAGAEGLRVLLQEDGERGAVEEAAVERLGRGGGPNLVAHEFHVLNEIWPEFGPGEELQGLELALLLDGAPQGRTVAG